jgi:hypothetical protein
VVPVRLPRGAPSSLRATRVRFARSPQAGWVGLETPSSPESRGSAERSPRRSESRVAVRCPPLLPCVRADEPRVAGTHRRAWIFHDRTRRPYACPAWSTNRSSTPMSCQRVISGRGPRSLNRHAPRRFAELVACQLRDAGLRTDYYRHERPGARETIYDVEWSLAQGEHAAAPPSPGRPCRPRDVSQPFGAGRAARRGGDQDALRRARALLGREAPRATG